MRESFTRRMIKSGLLATISLLVGVGICYAAVQNFGGDRLVNVGGITIGSVSDLPNQIEFEQADSLLGFHSGTESILMRGGNDRICLGYGNDELTFNTGNGSLIFGGDWFTGTNSQAGMSYTESTNELLCWSVGPCRVFSGQSASISATGTATVSGDAGVSIRSDQDVVIVLGQ